MSTFQASPTPHAHTSESEDLGCTLARFAMTLTYESLPSEVVRITKQCILDTLGTTLAATTLAPEAPMFRDYVRDVGGAPDCTLIGYGEKAPTQMAAFLNGANSHMLDFDDVGTGHVSVATIPVAFAVAEKAGNIGGRELLTAVAAGIDIHTRIFPYDTTEEWDLNQIFSQTQSIGYLSGVAVASRLARLTIEQAINAWGLAYQQVAGPHQRHLGMHAGWCGQGAVLATLLAQRGVPGVKDILNGKHGLFRTHLRNVDPDPVRLTGELGTRFRNMEVHGFKPWPACGLTRRPVNAVIDMRREHDLRPEDVEAVVVSGGEHILRLADPLEFRRRPPHSAQAKFSIPFTIAVAMAYGDVRLHNYTPDGLKDPAVLALADRVWVEKDTNTSRRKESASVEIRMRDGRRFSKHVLYPLGDDRRNPMSQTQIEDKFRDCASFSLKPIAQAQVEGVIGLVADLENVADVAEITRLL